MRVWNLKSELCSALPALGWLARTCLSGGEVRLLHGQLVETSADWAVEGVWDGLFEEGNFYNHEGFFGSGVRLEKQRIHFCASLAMVDRLLYARVEDDILVSNSLLLLLAETGAELDFNHDYRNECHASIKGIWDYPREFPVLHPTIANFYQVYSGNLVLSSDGIQHEPRARRRNISSFEQYQCLLTDTLARLQENISASSRQHPMECFSTLSAGYDSTAVTCLACDIGLEKCFTTSPGRTRASRHLENGRKIADVLGIESVVLDPEEDSVSENELWFLSPTLDGSEIIFDSMARHIESNCAPAVIFSGYHGDKIWDRHTSGKYLQDNILRGDTSGLNLSEIRLKAGFINLAVPFLYARNIADVVTIANNADMGRWQMNNDYDRPIPRRIAESHGVPRNRFGQSKRAVMNYYSRPMNKQLRRDFDRFLKDRFGMSRSYLLLYRAVEGIDYVLFRLFFQQSYPNANFRDPPWSLRKKLFGKVLDVNSLMFFWANSTLKTRLQQDLGYDSVAAPRV